MYSPDLFARFFFCFAPRTRTPATYSPSQSADLSTLFDVGGIFGGIAAGIFTDMFGKSACTCAIMLFLAIPSVSDTHPFGRRNRFSKTAASAVRVFQLYAYNLLSSVNLYVNIAMLLVAGGLVNGPYALITTAVSAELGTHSSLKGNAKALSTVTSIIDGTGSIGKTRLFLFSLPATTTVAGTLTRRRLFVLPFRRGRRTSAGRLHIQSVRLDKRLLHAHGFQRSRDIGKIIIRSVFKPFFFVIYVYTSTRVAIFDRGCGHCGRRPCFLVVKNRSVFTPASLPRRMKLIVTGTIVGENETPPPNPFYASKPYCVFILADYFVYSFLQLLTRLVKREVQNVG